MPVRALKMDGTPGGKGRFPEWIIILAGLVLVGLVGFLIWRNHVSYLDIKELAVSRLEAESRNRARAISSFLLERSNDIQRLADSKQVLTYFENKAPGMPQAHGLKENRTAVKALFERTIETTRLGGTPLYEAIALLDGQSRPQILCGMNSGKELADILCKREAANAGVWPSLDFDPESGQAVIGSAVELKGETRGFVLVLIPLRAALHSLMDISTYSPGDFIGLTMGRRPAVPLVGSMGREDLDAVPPPSRPGEARFYSAPAERGSDGQRRLVVWAAIAGTPLSYLAIVLDNSLNARSPMAISIALGGLAVLSMSSLMVISRSRTRQIVLNARLEEKSRAQVQLLHQAFHDQLTGLPNRLLMADYLKHSLELASRNKQLVGVLLLDLDRFKEINDTQGHGAGDEALRQVSERIRAAIRKSDKFGRLGGDEFLLLAENAPAPEALAGLAEAVLKAFDAPFPIRGKDAQLGVSIGIAVYPLDGTDADTLIKSADLAMYHSKESGKNTYSFFKKSLMEKMLAKCSQEQALRQALRQDGLLLHYQPILRTETLSIAGCEALVRWRNADGDITGSGDFLPLAEKTGIIEELDLWVLEKATAAARGWHDAGHPVPMGVNVSLQSLQRNGFARRVGEVLERNGYPPRLLELEITEPSLMSSRESSMACLHELKEMGVRVVLDDFGKGYSSLIHLNRLPLERLKIDRSFIRDITGEGFALVKAIIDLATGLDIPVVAEGVETHEQFAALHGMRCQFVQGYFYSPPVAGELFADLLARGPGTARPARPAGRADSCQYPDLHS